MGLHPKIEPGLHGLAGSPGQALIGDDSQLGVQNVFAGDKFAHGLTGPADRAVGSEHELFVGRPGKARCARIDFAGEPGELNSSQLAEQYLGAKG